MQDRAFLQPFSLRDREMGMDAPVRRRDTLRPGWTMSVGVRLKLKVYKVSVGAYI